jgi:hypothetical protein
MMLNTLRANAAANGIAMTAKLLPKAVIPANAGIYKGMDTGFRRYDEGHWRRFSAGVGKERIR